MLYFIVNFNLYLFVVCGLWFVVLGLGFGVCGLRMSVCVMGFRVSCFVLPIGGCISRRQPPDGAPGGRLAAALRLLQVNPAAPAPMTLSFNAPKLMF